MNKQWTIGGIVGLVVAISAAWEPLKATAQDVAEVMRVADSIREIRTEQAESKRQYQEQAVRQQRQEQQMQQVQQQMTRQESKLDRIIEIMLGANP